MSTALATTVTNPAELALVTGDLSKLSAEQRTAYYGRVCETVGLNPMTKPFDYITLNGKLTLYALKSATDQLRSLRGVSIEIVAKEVVDGVLTVTARASTPDGRRDEDIGAVLVAGLKGENLANAHMKCITKAKRRVTLSICGLGMLDESEVDSIPSARPLEPDPAPVARIAHVVDAVEDGIVSDWCERFGKAESVDELLAMRDSCKQVIKDGTALLQIGVAFTARQKQLKANGAPNGQ